MDWVSFDEIKKTVSLEMVLDHYAVRLRRVGPNTLRGKCPLPTHGSKTSTESFTATLNKGTGGAWACQSASCVKTRGRVGGNTLDFVAAMESCSVRDAAIKLQTWFLVPAAGQSHKPEDTKPKKELASKERTHQGGEHEANQPLAFELQKIDYTHEYLRSRGVSEATARKFGVGVFSGKGSMQGRCVIPIHNEKGELVAYAGRSIDEAEPRYKFPAGFHKSLELFNLHRVIGELNPPQRVVVVEGFFDCVRVSEAGYACVALMGAAMSEAQEALIIRHFKAACILLDGDEAGKRASMDCLMRLGRRMWAWAPLLPAGMQPDMLSLEQIQTLLSQ